MTSWPVPDGDVPVVRPPAFLIFPFGFPHLPAEIVLGRLILELYAAFVAVMDMFPSSFVLSCFPSPSPVLFCSLRFA